MVLFHVDRDLWLPNTTCNCFGICVDNQSGILYACRLLLKYITLRIRIGYFEATRGYVIYIPEVPQNNVLIFHTARLRL